MTLHNNTKEMGGQVEIVLLSSDANVVYSTWPSLTMWRTHAPTFNKWHKKKKNEDKNKKVTLDMLTHGAMRGCGLASWVVCIDDKFCDKRDRDVTTRSEI